MLNERTRRQATWGTVVVGLLLLSACGVSFTPGYIEDDEKAAELAVQRIHEQYNSRRFDAIRNTAHEVFRAAQPAEAMLANLRETFERYGKFERLVECRINVLVGAPVEVRAICNSQYEKAIATEMIGFIKVGAELQLAQFKLAPGPAQLPEVK
jgi:hypothetical protein